MSLRATLRRGLLALATGLAAFLVVGVTVTELASARIEFSLFVGIPAGLLAGLVAAAFVAMRLGPNVAPERRRPALALAAFGVVFLAALLVATLGLDVRNSVALPVAAVVGLVVAGAVYLGERADTADDSETILP